MGKVRAVCLSRRPISWLIPRMKVYNQLAPDSGLARVDQKIRRDRVRFLANWRNTAVESALRFFPETEHILMIDEPYVKYPDSIEKLVEAYDGLCVLGASTWIRVETHIFPRFVFYDTWACPGTEKLSWFFRPPSGIVRTNSVGAVYIFPVYVWKRNGYGVPEPFPEAGNEHTYMLKDCPIPIVLNFEIRFWRTQMDADLPRYPWTKRIRCTIGDAKNRIISSGKFGPSR